MATLGLTEFVLDAFMVKLKAGLTSRIAAVNAGTGDDDVQLGTPLMEDYYLGGVAAIPSGRCPAIIVTDGGTGDGGGFTQEGPHGLIYTLEVIVFFLDEDSDRQRLARKLLRLERAIIETMWDDEPKEYVVAADGHHVKLAPLSIQPGPVFDPREEGQPYRQWRSITFDAEKFE